MAAGLGTRLRPFTERCPKPLLPLLGVPVAQFGVDALGHAGVETIVANVHHLPDAASRGLERLDLKHACLRVSDERGRILGSAGGIRKALSLLGNDPFFLLNGDVLTAVDLEALAKQHQRLRRKFGVSLTLTIFPAGPRGQAYREIFVDYRKGLIEGFGTLAVDKPFFAGVAVIEPEAVAHLVDGEPAEFVPRILEPAIRAGKAGAYLASGPWYDVGSPRLWFDAHWELLDGFCGRNGQSLPELWRQRLEADLRKVGPAGFVEKSAPADLDVSKWQEPYYWNPLGRQEGGPSAAPAEMGPRAVLYGSAPASALRHGIGFSGLWVSCDETLKSSG